MEKREVLVWAFSFPETKMNSLIRHHGQLPAQPQETAAKPFVSEHDWDVINTGSDSFLWTRLLGVNVDNDDKLW